MSPAPTTTAADYIPPHPTLKLLREAEQRCEACSLYRNATQAVGGAGPEHARIMVVGEMPGNEEDKQGEPFVGPAGRILQQALRQAEVDPQQVYVTNAVKHFKWKPQGKRRLHQKPSNYEVEVCKPWLEAELLLVQPRVVVAMGTTAARSLLGRKPTIAKDREQVHEGLLGTRLIVTYHPSSVLRAMSHAEDKGASIRETLASDLAWASRLAG